MKKNPAFFVIICLFMLLLTVGSALSITDDAVGAWSFDDADIVDTDDQTDLSGNANTLIAQSAITTGFSGLIDESYDFDGSSDWTRIADGTVLDIESGNMALSAWVYRDVTGNGQHEFICKKDGSTESYCMQFYNGYLWCSFGQGSGTATKAMASQAWQHVVCSLNGTTVSACVNGSCATEALGAANRVSSANFEIGSRNGGTTLMNGKIDMALVYDHALSAADIAELYNSGTGFNPYDVAGAPETVTIYVYDRYDNATLSGLNVTLSDGTSNLTDATGLVTFYKNGTFTYNITDPSNIYFDLVGTDSITNGTINRAYVYGARYNFSVYDVNNSLISSWNITSGTQTNTTSGTWSYLYLKPNTTNTVVVDKSGYYDLTSSIATSGKDLSNYNLTGLYQTTINITAYSYLGAAISNFTINYSGDMNGQTTTTDGQAEINLLFGNYTFLIMASGYAYDNITLNLNTTGTTHNFSLYTQNSINISFYDEETDEFLNFTTITLDIYNNNFSTSVQTTVGWIYYDFLSPNTYTLRYGANGYITRTYSFILYNNTFTELNLTLLNASSGSVVYVVVKDTLDNLLEGAIVKVYKRNFLTGTLDIVETLITNFEGTARASITLNDDIYQFIVEYDGEVVLTTIESQIYGSTVTLIVDLIRDTGFEEVFRGYTLSGNVVYINNTHSVKFTYNDESNTAAQGCLRIYNLTSSKVLHAQSCSANPSGTITVVLNNETGSAYQAEGYIIEGSGLEYYIDGLVITFGDTIPEDGSSLLMIVLMIVLFAFAVSYSIELAVIIAGFVPLMFTITGLTQLPYFVTMPLFAGAIIVAFIIGVMKK